MAKLNRKYIDKHWIVFILRGALAGAFGFIALFGGWIWQTLGIELLFIASAVLGLCNSAYAANIKPKNAV